jgi:hypothetical protein
LQDTKERGKAMKTYGIEFMCNKCREVHHVQGNMTRILGNIQEYGWPICLECGGYMEECVVESKDYLQTLRHILDMAEENTKGIDGYEQIAEWARNALG